MARVFKCRISDIASIAGELHQYSAELTTKCHAFIKEMETVGYSVAVANTGNFGKYITIFQKVNPIAHGCEGILVASQTGIIKSSWIVKEDGQEVIKTADVSPLLMCEYGSGLEASNPMGMVGVGQGTFPNQTHASDPEGWWYMDLNHNWVHAYGIKPHAPMYKALVQMQATIMSVAKTTLK